MITLDVSNHDLSVPFDAQCLAASGVSRFVVGCWDYDATARIVREGRAAGIAVQDLYCYLYFGLAHEQREIENALRVAAEFGGVQRIWMDVEASAPWEAPGQTPATRIAATRRAVARVQAAGHAVGIYTYPAYWRAQMANTREFAELPLWLALWGQNDPNAPQPPIREYQLGGWSTLAAHQYSSLIVRCGRVRDHDYWYLDEEDDMDEATVRRLIAEALEARPDDDVDDRLREVMAWRLAGQHVFAHPDSAVVQAAYQALVSAGLIAAPAG